jgi:hypothetical protein
MSVNKIAAAYLNFLKIKEQRNEKYVTEDLTPQFAKLADTHEVTHVIVSRTKEPKFYAGTLGRSNRAVWTNDEKQARPVDAAQIHVYEQQLNETLFPQWPYSGV